MSQFFKVAVKVHNVTINCNGIKTFIKNANLELPNSDAYGYRAVEACRVINQWLVGISLYNKLSQRDQNECKSCGELGTNLSALFNDPNKKTLVYKSDRYKYGKGCSYFMVNAKYIDGES